MSTKIWQDLSLIENLGFLSKKFRGRGTLEFSGELRFAGAWRGELLSEDPDSRLYVLPGAVIEGRIRVAELIVAGDLSDVAVETQFFKALSSAKITGQIRAESLLVEEGALVEGDLFSVSAQKSKEV